MVEMPNNKQEVVQKQDLDEKSDKSGEVSWAALEKKVWEIKTPEEFHKTKDVKDENIDSVENADILKDRMPIDFSKVFNVINSSSNKVDLLSNPEIKDKINNILKMYGISKPIDWLTKQDMQHFSSEGKSNLAYSLAMVKTLHSFKNSAFYSNLSLGDANKFKKYIETWKDDNWNTVNLKEFFESVGKKQQESLTPQQAYERYSFPQKQLLNSLQDTTKTFYKLFANTSDARILPQQTTLAVWDWSNTAWIDGKSSNYWRMFFDYNAKLDKIGQNEKSVLWTQDTLSLDLKVAWVDWPWANILVSIGEKQLRWHTEWPGKSWIIWENQSEIASSGISIDWTHIVLDSNKLWNRPDVSLKVIANSFVNKETWLVEPNNKDEVLTQITTNWILDDSFVNPESARWLDFFDFWEYTLSQSWKQKMDSVKRIFDAYDKRILDVNDIKKIPIAISAGVDYVWIKEGKDFTQDKKDLIDWIQKLVSTKQLSFDVNTLVTSMQEKTKSWNDAKQSDLVICRALTSITYLLQKLPDGKDSELVKKIDFSVGDLIKWKQTPSQSTGEWVQKDRYFSFYAKEPEFNS